MEGRPPPDGDDLFEWTDAPARPSRPGSIRGDTGEFERGGRRPPSGRRARRRDLPARVRRRQDLMVGAAGVAVIVLLIAAISSGGGGGSEPAIGLKRLVGQTIVARLGAKGPDQALLQRVKRGRGVGVIAFNRGATNLKAESATLQQAGSAGDGPPLLVMVD